MDGQCREAMDRCSSLISTAQWAKMGANWNIHGVKINPISDFVALEQIDLCERKIANP